MFEKEMRIRLRRDGEIVGFLNIGGGVITAYDELGLMLNAPKLWDSFDIGVLVGEKRWFHGDRIETRSGLSTLVYALDVYGIPAWYLRMDIGGCISLWYAIGEGQDCRKAKEAADV